jgi:tetratricopeptide (TPR) repeat protein
MVVFEDLHWVDAETQALLDALVDSLPTARILLLVNHRPEYPHGWGRKSYYQQLSLDPLPPDSTDELLDSLLGDDPAFKPVKRLLVERTEGNPFFLEESVRTLRETHALVGHHGAYRPAPGAELVDHGLRIPATAQDVVAARIDRLAPEDKRLLQAASVIGKDVPCALLEAIADEPAEAVRRSLANLQANEYLYEARLFPDLEYTFRHALTHEVVYSGVLQERRRPLHARIVEAIERLYPDRLVEHVERLSHHAVRGEVWPSAVRYLRNAGAKAFGRSANRESAAYFEQALVALAHLPESRETTEQTVDTRFDLRNSLQLLGDLDAVIRHLREAEPAVRALDDPWRLGWWSTYMGHYFWITGRAMEARDFGERSVELARQVADLPLRVVANLYYGLACNTAGDYRRADAVVRTIVETLEGDVARERFGQVGFPVVTSRCYLVYALTERGQFAEGIACGREGLRLARELDHPYSIGLMSWNLARLYMVKGEVDPARALIEESHELSRQGNFILSSPRTIWSLGHLAVLEGRIADGLVLLEQALAAFESVGMRIYQSMVAVDLGAAYGEAGRLDEARACVARALALAREREQRGHVAYALHLAGDLAARAAAPDAAAADSSFREALKLADDLGMRPLAARCHLSLGTLDRGAGNAGETRAHLETAIAMFDAMEMELWRERAERARAQLRV